MKSILRSLPRFAAALAFTAAATSAVIIGGAQNAGSTPATLLNAAPQAADAAVFVGGGYGRYPNWRWNGASRSWFRVGFTYGRPGFLNFGYVGFAAPVGPPCWVAPYSYYCAQVGYYGGPYYGAAFYGGGFYRPFYGGFYRPFYGGFYRPGFYGRGFYGGYRPGYYGGFARRGFGGYAGPGYARGGFPRGGYAGPGRGGYAGPGYGRGAYGAGAARGAGVGGRSYGGGVARGGRR